MSITVHPTAPPLAEVRQLVIAGFTGRDAADVQAHLDELAAEGIPVPDEFPTFYDVDLARLKVVDGIEVASPQSSGEVEPVLVRNGGTWWFGIGSDHTARDVERESIAASKRACDKIVGAEFWPWDEIADDFDRLHLRSWVQEDGTWQPYQDALASSMLPPEEILARFEAAYGPPEDGLVLFLGTVPLLTHGFVYGDAFRARIDAADARHLQIDYDIRVTPRPESR